MAYSLDGSEYVARAIRLRKLMMAGPSDPASIMVGINEIINERIDELRKRLDDGSGTASGLDSEP